MNLVLSRTDAFTDTQVVNVSFSLIVLSWNLKYIFNQDLNNNIQKYHIALGARSASLNSQDLQGNSFIRFWGSIYFWNLQISKIILWKFGISFEKILRVEEIKNAKVLYPIGFEELFFPPL